ADPSVTTSNKERPRVSHPPIIRCAKPPGQLSLMARSARARRLAPLAAAGQRLVNYSGCCAGSRLLDGSFFYTGACPGRRPLDPRARGAHGTPSGGYAYRPRDPHHGILHGSLRFAMAPPGPRWRSRRPSLTPALATSRAL